ncbi:cryptochrome/photolyase family protein [Hydrogenophaga sp.]|uniref:cryptochrome/photolyase family protein n=1 Tax=Hydrogenophaga sp. TaxID=1904254 RepID=UPI0027347BBE|nr:cryptochrome/photolyase family protein [Hydrogenophaga sp.]MDP3886721.1 cryptochrome/photolyase family protein [Hydrogenophaga sp.]
MTPRPTPQHATPLRRLVLVLGDQLWLGNPALASFDPAQDAVLMIEAPGEATQFWNHKARIAVFLSAMRHFGQTLTDAGLPCHYLALDDPAWDALPSLPERLAHALARFAPQTLWLCEPGEWRLQQDIAAVAHSAGVPLQVLEDTHFLCSRARFARWASGRKEWRMEYFYREMRREHGVLMDGKAPVGGQWNFDADNRKSYPKAGPGWIPEPAHFAPDATTREVIALVQARFPDHPGQLEHFGWPVTPEQAQQALQHFVDERLECFGSYQDAMWTDTPFGWHSLLSVALNLHLIDPRDVIRAAEAAHHERGLPLASVEGFIRQILGWREFIRGVYWLDMPGMKTANHFGHQRALPRWYWTGQTHMACMQDTIGQTLKHGYAHHIQRLMVTGQFALLAELQPQQVADWYLAVYVDAVEWVELPNVAGMALFANGGRFTSKPYVASGQYISRMSNHCRGCRYQPDQRTGPNACPMTTLYWNFLDRHETELAASPRTALMVRNLTRLSPAEREALRQQAALTLAHLDGV